MFWSGQTQKLNRTVCSQFSRKQIELWLDTLVCCVCQVTLLVPDSSSAGTYVDGVTCNLATMTDIEADSLLRDVKGVIVVATADDSTAASASTCNNSNLHIAQHAPSKILLQTTILPSAQTSQPPLDYETWLVLSREEVRTVHS